MLHCIYLAPQLYLQKRSFENKIIHSFIHSFIQRRLHNTCVPHVDTKARTCNGCAVYYNLKNNPFISQFTNGKNREIDPFKHALLCGTYPGNSWDYLAQ